MATAKKTPSGSWRCQVFDHDEVYYDKDGNKKIRRIRKSFTVDDPSPAGKRKCEKLAAEWAAEKQNKKKPCTMTLGECIDDYIRINYNVWSPKTVKEYKSMRKNIYQDLMDVKIEKITRQQIQNEISKDCVGHAPKTVKNHYGLLTAVMGDYRPDFKPKAKLPQKVKFVPKMPKFDDVSRLVEAIENDPMEMPILLSVFCSLRREEIVPITCDDVDGNILHIKTAVVLDEFNHWVEKPPKADASDRFIQIPEFVAEKIKAFDGKVTDLNPAQISNRWRAMKAKHGFDGIRFHDLRHFSASFYAAYMSRPYLKNYFGWSSNSSTDRLYTHILQEHSRRESEIAINAIEELILNKKN